MAETVSLMQVIQQARKIYADLDTKASVRAVELDAKCTKGCAACCYQLVGVSFAEALIIAEELFRTRKRAQLDELLVHLDQHAEALRKNDARTMMFLEKRYCPLLEIDPNDPFKGLCSVYASRPLACRLQFVISDPRWCQPDAIYECTMIDTTEVQLSAMGMITGQVPMLARYGPLQPFVAYALRLVLGKEKDIDDAYLIGWTEQMQGYLEHDQKVQIQLGKKDKYVP
jgi:Fe-S-cluster containining protein